MMNSERKRPKLLNYALLRRKKKIILTAFLMITLAFFLAGCKSFFPLKDEIDKILIVRTVGIDKIAEGENKVMLTIAARIAERGGKSEGGGGAGLEVITFEGRTLFEAIREFHTFSDKSVFWAHTDFILFGEDTAREELLSYLDVFVRDHETRLTAKLVIVRGSTAYEVISKANTPQFYLAERLENLFENARFISYSDKVDIVEAVNLFDSKISSALLPYITLVKHTEREEEENILDVKLEGFAVFSGNRLAGFFPEELGRGINWIRGETNLTALLLEDDQKMPIAMEVIKGSSKILPHYENGRFSVNIQISVNSNIAEYMGKDNIFVRSKIQELNRKQEELVKKEAETALKLTKELNADVLGIGEAIYRKYPVKFRRLIGRNWLEIYPDIPVSVEVNSVIRRTYNIEEPIGGEEGPRNV